MSKKNSPNDQIIFDHYEGIPIKAGDEIYYPLECPRQFILNRGVLNRELVVANKAILNAVRINNPDCELLLSENGDVFTLIDIDEAVYMAKLQAHHVPMLMTHNNIFPVI